ncbi:MAG: excinuclease ABC subunit UvrA, partial [Phycisphaerales bacterium]|nr:excinuclease ABC subunit UvrA [Phycisphaerales bacterium]
TESDHVRSWLMTCMTHMQCPSCCGERLRIEARSVTVESSGQHYSITQLTSLTIAELLEVVNAIALTSEQTKIAEPILKEIKSRLTFLVSVGLDYLSLNRTSSTLSGGESQRIRLATQVGSGLVGVCYVLDEPTIGLHARDNERLLKTLHHLSAIGNTVLVVEHDEEIIRSADHIVDVGPQAGLHGGKIVCQGSLDEILKHKQSLTSKYLNGTLAIPTPAKRRAVLFDNSLSVTEAVQNNLKKVDVDLPLNVMTCITGVSGSGKSSLVNQVLLSQMARVMKGESVDQSLCKSVDGIGNIDRLIEVDQSPIGRTPRSNPATYTGIFDHIRSLFTQTREAKIRGYKPGRFSFNVKGGRCESCQGQGVKRIEMHFLPDTYVTCEECNGARYNSETLEVKWRGYTISDILNATIEDACEIFASHPKIARMLDCLKDVGLSYLTLGQPSTTLSGGEAQRVKLASELGVQSKKQTLYVLDEPTTGLHFADIDKLLLVLHRLVDAGNTVIIIEHNLEIIKNADWVIDLGPEGGDGGGEIVCEGTPEQVAKHKSSFTGRALKGVVKASPTSRKRKTCSSKS